MMALSKYPRIKISTPSIGDQPRQTSSFSFPKKEFSNNKVTQTFQALWFKKWKWLHYSEKNEVAFCFLCVQAYEEGKLFGKSSDAAFVSTGFKNWKDACVKFRNHDSSNSHQELLKRLLHGLGQLEILVNHCLQHTRQKKSRIGRCL